MLLDLLLLWYILRVFDNLWQNAAKDESNEASVMLTLRMHLQRAARVKLTVSLAHCTTRLLRDSLVVVRRRSPARRLTRLDEDLKIHCSMVASSMVLRSLRKVPRSFSIAAALPP